MSEPGQRLQMFLRFRKPLYSADREVDELIEAVDSALLFEVAREALSVIQPRKRFATDLGVTVGSVRATKSGQYYVGPRDMPAGLDKLEEFRQKERLGNYDRHYWGPPLTVNTGFDLARPAYGKSDAVEISSVHASFKIAVEAARAWIDPLTHAMFEFFTTVSTIAQPLNGRGSWWSHGVNNEFERLAGVREKSELGQATVPGYRTILYLPPEAVTKLGGADAVSTQAPVAETRMILHADGSVGMTVLLCRTPEELSVERLQAWRSYLHPVLDLPEERFRPASWADRSPNGWLASFERPLDILPVDFEGL